MITDVICKERLIRDEVYGMVRDLGVEGYYVLVEPLLGDINKYSAAEIIATTFLVDSFLVDEDYETTRELLETYLYAEYKIDDEEYTYLLDRDKEEDRNKVELILKYL